MEKYLRLSHLLKELIPFLQKNIVEFIEHVDSVLEGIAQKSKPQVDLVEISEFECKVEVMWKNLESIIERLKQGTAAKKRFIEMYPKWRKVRKDVIKNLKEISKSLNEDRRNCNVSKLVGYSTSLVGGALCLASAVLIPFTMGMTTPLAIAGGTMTAAGCSTTIGTSITEVVLLKSKVGQAQKLIEEDKNYYKEMTDWMQHVAALTEAITEILNIDIIKDVVKDVEDFVKKALALPKGVALKRSIEKALKLIIQSLPKRLTEVLSVISIVNVISVLVGLFVLMINTKTRIVFDCANVTLRSLVGIAAFADDAADALRITYLLSSNAVLAKDVAKAFTRGALSIVGMALDVTGIALTSIDVHKGSLSPEAKQIADACEGLEKETKTIDEVHENLKLPSS